MKVSGQETFLSSKVSIIGGFVATVATTKNGHDVDLEEIRAKTS